MATSITCWIDSKGILLRSTCTSVKRRSLHQADSLRTEWELTQKYKIIIVVWSLPSKLLPCNKPSLTPHQQEATHRLHPKEANKMKIYFKKIHNSYMFNVIEVKSMWIGMMQTLNFQQWSIFLKANQLIKNIFLILPLMSILQNVIKPWNPVKGVALILPQKF